MRLGSAGGSTRSGAVEVVGGGRRGYAIVAGRDVRGSNPGVVVERGLADAWHLGVGDELFVGRLGSLPIAGIAVEPDNVAFPLASTAHVYLASAFLDETFGRDRTPRANVALVWLHDGASTATFLQQARASSYGVTGLRFVTRSGIRVQLDDAAGIVVALLGAVALVGLLAAAVLIAAGAQADVQRGLATIGVQRAIGLPRVRRRGRLGAVRRGARAARGRRRPRARRRRRVRPDARACSARSTSRPRVVRCSGRWPSRCWASSRSSRPARRGPHGAPRGAARSRCCAARS